jgi:hypothetical protein
MRVKYWKRMHVLLKKHLTRDEIFKTKLRFKMLVQKPILEA